MKCVETVQTNTDITRTDTVVYSIFIYINTSFGGADHGLLAFH